MPSAQTRTVRYVARCLRNMVPRVLETGGYAREKKQARDAAMKGMRVATLCRTGSHDAECLHHPFARRAAAPVSENRKRRGTTGRGTAIPVQQ